MIPLAQILLLTNYPVEQRSLANGIWGMTAVVGPVAGPILGGWITDHISWAWIFVLLTGLVRFARPGKKQSISHRAAAVSRPATAVKPPPAASPGWQNGCR